MSFFDELKRRKVFRVAIGYIVAAWVVAQVADLVADNFNAPDWMMQMFLTLLVVGLPVALLLSWAFDFTTDGIKRTASKDDEDKLVVSNKAVLGFVAGLVLVLPIAFFLLWPRGDRSVAVLPFEDVSPGGDQAYLGIGIADELRLELQHLEGLRVAGRTSSTAYAEEGGKTIGEVLNVETILEGSVRKEEDSIRITVQLTDASDGFTIWSQVYDRDLEKIFEMQEEIATEVAGRLGVSLGVGDANAFHGAGTRNIEAYEAVLRARSTWKTARNSRTSRALLERAAALDPEYAVAWSELAVRVLNDIWDADLEKVPEIKERALQLGLRAVQLDPNSADVKSGLALIRMNQFDWIGAEQDNVSAIDLLADRLTIERYALMLMRSGRINEAEKWFIDAVEMEPMDGRPHPQIWHVRMAQGRLDEAQETLNFNNAGDLFEDNLDVAFSRREPEALKVAIRAMPDTNIAFVSLYEPLLAAFDSPDRVSEMLQAVYADESLAWPRKLHDIAMAAAYFGDPEFALEVKGREVSVSPVRLTSMWEPVMSDVRRLPEFKELAAELNLVEYWRAYGWADACRALGNDDFECS